MCRTTGRPASMASASTKPKDPSQVERRQTTSVAVEPPAPRRLYPYVTGRLDPRRYLAWPGDWRPQPRIAAHVLVSSTSATTTPTAFCWTCCSPGWLWSSDGSIASATCTAARIRGARPRNSAACSGPAGPARLPTTAVEARPRSLLGFAMFCKTCPPLPQPGRSSEIADNPAEPLLRSVDRCILWLSGNPQSRARPNPTPATSSASVVSRAFFRGSGEGGWQGFP